MQYRLVKWAIVLKREEKDAGLSRYTIIDGQQRILTLTIFLTAIMFQFKKRDMMADFGGTQKYLVALDHKNNYREIVYPEYHLSLPKLVNAVIEWSSEEISKYSLNAFSNICTVSPARDKPIVDAFKFFSGRIDALDNDRLLSLRDAVINIGYVEIISSTEEDSYTIFEILNARGLDPEDHELLKNYIMRYLQPVERRDDAKRIWEDIEGTLGSSIKSFFRHYAVHKYNYDSRKHPSVYKALQIATHGRGMDQLLDDIARKSTYYSKIVAPSRDDQLEYTIFSFFKAKRFVLFRPLLLTLIHCKDLEIISCEKYNKTLQFLYCFFICYKIIGAENSNLLTNVVNKYAYQLETALSPQVLEECLDSMRKRLPTLESFTNNFKELCWSHHWDVYADAKNKERCQLVLAVLEEYSSSRAINLSVTIEHILPDADSIENAQIGNMLFIEEALNEQCSNKPLSEKIEIYKESVLQLPRLFAMRYGNKEFRPEQRTKFLARFFYNNILGIPDQVDNKEAT